MNFRRSLPHLTAALAVSAALVLSACGSDASDSKTYKFSSATKTGALISESSRKPAADFSGDLLSGGTMTLSDSAGKVRVVNFWGSWCPPCVAETPQLDGLYRKVKSKGVAFIGIDTKDDKDAAKSFIADNDITYPMIFDQQGRTIVELGNIPGSLPFTVLVDKTGDVAAVYLGILTPKDLEPPIDKLLAEQ